MEISEKRIMKGLRYTLSFLLFLSSFPSPSSTFPAPVFSSSSSATSPFHLDNSRPPAITRQSRRKDVVFDAREDLTLICDAVGVPAITYEWRKNGAVLDIDQHKNISIALGRGDLIIKSPGTEDEGIERVGW